MGAASPSDVRKGATRGVPRAAPKQPNAQPLRLAGASSSSIDSANELKWCVFEVIGADVDYPKVKRHGNRASEVALNAQLSEKVSVMVRRHAFLEVGGN